MKKNVNLDLPKGGGDTSSMRVTPGHTSALENALILSHVYKPSSFDTSEATRPLSMDS